MTFFKIKLKKPKKGSDEESSEDDKESKLEKGFICWDLPVLFLF